MYIPIILGTAGTGRQSEKAAKFVLGEVLAAGLESEILDVQDFRLSATDNSGSSMAGKKLSEKMERADGLIIVSPEYNHGYPGELKMMLDLCYGQYFHKPVGICGVSAGGLGGARMVEQLRQVLIELHMVPVREAVYFSGVGDLFDDSGAIKDASFKGRVKIFLDEIVWYADPSKEARK